MLQELEWEDSQKSRAEERATNHDTIKLRRDDDDGPKRGASWFSQHSPSLSCQSLFLLRDFPRSAVQWVSSRSEDGRPRCFSTPRNVVIRGHSEHIMRVTDVLCLSVVTIHGLALEWLDAEELDVRPGQLWVKKLLHGMLLSCKKPAKCMKELHSPEQQHANTHRLFIKLC